ncbi:hypothetical protein HYDPIDRAFT_41484 [Hydnomerulius pinastri MD-312]|uniref:Unplaced genomic scaffold scaffold_19, whole genome shotgun sequence n=1 Tax=Hydnomerulius pinastri MD-312 TaxID=994086 RepID=A0A0C9W6X6_9AGAM|nr:hypothetical protein HYDPIDRAFT_41484 [Hydnomerulius pinastri MD-312]
MKPTIPVPRPLKRIRLDNDSEVQEVSSNPESSSSTSKANGVHVKRERSTSPLPTSRRLVTSGVKRYAPLPPNCLPTCPEYKRNRREWMGLCLRELQVLNLKTERKLIRDDGLIIDWSSPIPLWSDTLKPESLDLAATITLAHQTNAQRPHPRVRRDSPSKSRPLTTDSTPERPSSSLWPNGNASGGSPTKRKLPVPPRLSSMRRAITSQFASPSTSSSSPAPCKLYRLKQPSPSPPSDDEVAIIEGPLPSRPRSCDPVPGLPITTPAPTSKSIARNSRDHKSPPISELLPAVSTKPPNEVRDQSIPEYESSAVEEEISDMTMNYIRRYVQTYETDRAGLASAYSRNASFSYRVHKIDSSSGDTPPTIRQFSTQASSSGRKCARLDITTTLLTLPPLHSIPSPSPVVAQISYDILYLGANLGMFVRKEADPEEAAVEGVWPLVATAHQILVFES